MHFFSLLMITLKNVTLRRGTKVVLDSVNATINPAEHVGLVGRNGAGKSSLFALLNGTLHEDGGDFFIPTQWRMAQVAQHMPETDESATQFVLDGDTRLSEVNARLQAAEASGDGMAIAQAHADLQDAGAHDATARAQALILGLGFKTSELEHPVNSFSGGWRMRLQLARALMCPSDLLLLDEPTNHLDLATREALAMAINDFDGSVMLVSHDRHLLRAVCEDFWMVGRGVVGPFDGDLDDYQRYLLDESKRLREEAKQAELQQASAANASASAATEATASPIDQREARKLAAAARQQLGEKTKPLKKELEQVDQKMAALSAEKAALEDKLATPITPAEIAEAGKRLKAVGDELDTLEERWLELSEAIEQLTQEAGLPT